MKRPQHPEPPYPYKSEEITFYNEEDSIELAGTLTIPEESGPHPAVVLITGSGPQERDATVQGHKLFLVLADYLTRNGIAVLRYDERGMGESEGEFSGATSQDLSRDVKAATDFLNQHSAVHDSAIGMIGHSEGAMIAPMVATEQSFIDFVVLMAGPGVPGSELLLMQSKAIMEAQQGNGRFEVEKRIKLMDTLYRIVERYEKYNRPDSLIRKITTDYMNALSETKREQLGGTEEYTEQMVQQLTDPWMHYFIRYDPIPTLRQLQCPVLVLGGTKDLQVPPDKNLPPIRKALQEGVCKDYTVETIEGVNHLFQECETGLPSVYGRLEQTMSPRLLEKVTQWIQDRAPSLD